MYSTVQNVYEVVNSQKYGYVGKKKAVNVFLMQICNKREVMIAC